MVDIKIHEHIGIVLEKRRQELESLRKQADINIFLPVNDIPYIEGYLAAMLDYNLIKKDEYDVLFKRYTIRFI
jgi:hypothetical protein